MKHITRIFLIIVLIIAAAFVWNLRPQVKPNTELAKNYKDATFTIDNALVTLHEGLAVSDISTTSAARTTTTYFGNEARGDLNADGKEDIVFLLTQTTGGSGTFYYLVAALNTGNGYRGTNGIFLGDRISPQSVNINDDQILVSYGAHDTGDPMTSSTTIMVSRYFRVSGEQLLLVQ